MASRGPTHLRLVRDGEQAAPPRPRKSELRVLARAISDRYGQGPLGEALLLVAGGAIARAVGAPDVEQAFANAGAELVDELARVVERRG